MHFNISIHFSTVVQQYNITFSYHSLMCQQKMQPKGCFYMTFGLLIVGQSNSEQNQGNSHCQDEGVKIFTQLRHMYKYALWGGYAFVYHAPVLCPPTNMGLVGQLVPTCHISHHTKIRRWVRDIFLLLTMIGDAGFFCCHTWFFCLSLTSQYHPFLR